MDRRRLIPGLVFSAVVAASGPAMAQLQQAGSSVLLPWGTEVRPYLGLSMNADAFRGPCGLTAFGCSTEANAWQLSGVTLMGEHLGMQVGYLNLQRPDRAGETRAQGLNLSVVGRRSVISPAFGVFGRVGATYGRAETALAGPGPQGLAGDNAFGLSYGAGLSWDFSPRASATLSWDSHDFRAASGGRESLRSTSLGLQWRY